MKTYQVKLTKLSSNHSNIRTEVTVGSTANLPSVGEPFVLVADPLELANDFRFIYTTEIKLVEKLGNEYRFNTVNSTYKVEVLAENPESESTH